MPASQYKDARSIRRESPTRSCSMARCKRWESHRSRNSRHRPRGDGQGGMPTNRAGGASPTEPRPSAGAATRRSRGARRANARARPRRWAPAPLGANRGMPGSPHNRARWGVPRVSLGPPERRSRGRREGRPHLPRPRSGGSGHRRGQWRRGRRRGWRHGS